MNMREIENRVNHLKNLLDPERARREKRAERSKGLMKGLALGAFLGGLAGVLFAPDKGENTRQKAREELEKAKEILEVNYAVGKEKVSEFVEDQKEVLEEKMVVLKNKLNSKTACSLDDEEAADAEEEIVDQEA